MADWYVSSTAYAGIPIWVASHAYSVGDFVRPTAPLVNTSYAFRCTTAGTSGTTEPTWPTGNNATVTNGGATFTNVSGQSTYGWSAAAGSCYCISNAVSNRPAVGDRVFVSSDHTETVTALSNTSFGVSSAYGVIRFISVNRAGSVPPVTTDVQSGASIVVSSGGSILCPFDPITNVFVQGFIFDQQSANEFRLSNNGSKALYLKNCLIKLSNNSGIQIKWLSTSRAIFDNTQVQFANVGQSFSLSNSGSYLDLIWINTPSAILGTVPTTLFSVTANSAQIDIVMRGVDLSALNTTLITSPSSPWDARALLDSCTINAALTRWAFGVGVIEEIELVNCWDGTNIINERRTPAGVVSTDRSTYLSNGAQDDIGNYSLKLVSNANSDYSVFPLDCFPFDIENAAVGAAKTATVEIISSATLNNNDIRLLLEYMGATSTPLASLVDSLPSVLSTAAALPSSSQTWTNPPATPQKQLLQVSFTPQRAGRVRGLVRLGKTSTTAWVNPQIAIT